MASLAEELFELETHLQQPAYCRDPVAVAQLLADEFREIGGSGRIWDKSTILQRMREQGESEAIKCWMTEFEAKLLAPGVALVTFRSNSQRDAAEPADWSLRSSIWIERDGRWQMLFHQGTRPPAEEA